MATSPVFSATPNVGKVTLSVANANRDGTGSVGIGFTAGANGSRVERVQVKHKVTTTAGMIRMFAHDGTNFYALDELPVSAITVGASTPAFQGVFNQSLFPIILPTGWSLRFSTEKAEACDVVCFGEDA